MKKIITLSLAAAVMFCSCIKETVKVSSEPEFEITIGASIDAPSRTAFVSDGNKVIWLAGDKLGLKFTKTAATAAKNDNIALTLASGANSSIATFKGKTSTANAVPDGKVLVVYYPQISAVAKSGSVTDKDNIVLGGSFPKVQFSNDIQFDPNLMYGIATDVNDWPTTSDSLTPFEVKMKNVMSVIDFTFKGEAASIKRVFVTDLNTEAKAMTGDYTVDIKNGEFAGFATLPAGTKEYDRTIIAEYQVPVALTAEGVHVYVTVMPRTYSAGIEVGIETTDGDYMTKKITSSFTTESNNVYKAPELTFSAQTEAGKGIYENTIYTYSTFTDGRDENVYRYATLADGRDWMLDNLRFIPEDYTPSSDKNEINNGVWYPVVVNAAGTGVNFDSSDKAVSKFGFLYNISVALDRDAEYIYDLQKAVVNKEMTADAALAELKSIGAAGICPAGWTIPTMDEYNALYSASGSSMSGLGVQGFSLKDFGYFAVNNFSATSDPTTGTLSGWTAPKLNMTYIALSTPNSYTQYKAPMTNVTNNTAAVALLNSRSGVPVRCIRIKDK